MAPLGARLGDFMAKVQKEGVNLVSSVGSGSFYTFRRNKKKNKGEKKLSLKKYDPFLRKHVEYVEKKLSRLKKKFNPSKIASTEEVAEAPAADAA